MSSGLVSQKSQNEASLLQYNAIRNIGHELLKNRLAIQSKIKIEKENNFGLKPLSQTANDLRVIVTSEFMISYVNEIENILTQNKDAQPSEKFDVATRVITSWGKVVKKAVGDQQVSMNFINDIELRVKSLMTSFLTGQVMPIKSTKSEEEKYEQQKQLIIDKINELNAIKVGESNQVQLNINNNVSNLTRVLVTLSSIQKPLPDDLIDMSIKNAFFYADNQIILAKFDVLKKKDEENQRVIGEKIKEYKREKDIIDGNIQLLISKYEKIRDDTGKEIKEVQTDIRPYLGNKNKALTDAFDMAYMGVVETLDNIPRLLKDYQDGYIRFKNILGDENIDGIFPTALPQTEATTDSKKKEAIEKHLGVKDIAKMTGVTFGTQVIPKLSDATKKAWNLLNKPSQRSKIIAFVRHWNESFSDFAENKVKNRDPHKGRRDPMLDLITNDFKTILARHVAGKRKIKTKPRQKPKLKRKQKKMGGLGFPTANKISESFEGPRPPMLQNNEFGRITKIGSKGTHTKKSASENPKVSFITPIEEFAPMAGTIGVKVKPNIELKIPQNNAKKRVKMGGEKYVPSRNFKTITF